MEMLSNSVFDADKTKQTRIKYGQSAASFFLVLIGLILLLLFSLAFSVCIGIAGGNIRILADAIMHPVSASDIGKIMIDMRIPRALAACLTGAAFALAGAVMQGLTRNPLADAGLLGINAGAGLFFALSVALLPSASSIITIFSAFVGASFAVILVYGFGAGKRKTESFRLILAGASVSLVGGISFLGLIVPHTARFLVGGDYRRIMPVSALLGGVVLVLADVAARTVNAPFDTPVGALVSIIGVPIFFALTYRKGQGHCEKNI